MQGRMEVLPDPTALARHVAAWMVAQAEAGADDMRFCLSGGSTPKALYGLLATPEFSRRFPWERASWYWGDERFVPYDHPESNYRMAREAMLAKVPAPADRIHPIPTDGDPGDAAARYERVLHQAYGRERLDPSRPLFDVMLLGVGGDGHTASLLPGSSALEEREHWVLPVVHGRPEVRITLTLPAIESSRTVAFLVAGPDKAEILRRIRSGAEDLPAARIKPVGELIWFADRAAAGQG